LVTSFTAYLIQFINVTAPIDYLVLVPLGSMLLAILFDSRVAFFGTVAIAMLVGGLRGNDYILTLSHIAAGGLAAYSVRSIRNRSHIFRTFFYILFGYLAAIFAFGFERFLDIREILIEATFASTNALISPVFAYGFLYLFEKLFKMSTDLTFLELSDFNNLLLRELAQKAPGTFNHSLIIGTMVEEASNLIGGNSILARVGAYYHDIGKVYYPEAFVENQTKGENIHENLPPEKSAQIIIEHVDKGIELAKENGLPEEIIDFIPMHHGTLLVSYFYEKAKKLYGEENVKEEDYRYKGPKPNTKETGLLMLADACESAARAMIDETQEKLENLVANIIRERLEDGQLDETNLNFRDLKLIRSAFVKVLINQSHKRIRYPHQDKMENMNVAEAEN
jgi:putative nucleotidyltransferase with HDIG domain